MQKVAGLKTSQNRMGESPSVFLYRSTGLKLAIFAFSPDDEPVTAIKAAL
jgi:hypothetical protein